jgi:predicted GH43/DUF377 family glycosyl hydrolase
MALFPRKIGGRYAMIARHDNESLHLIYSDNLLEWELGTPIMRPQFPWEFIQIGNCGSPIELDEGWLLFTMVSGRCAITRSARCCWTRMTPAA